MKSHYYSALATAVLVMCAHPVTQQGILAVVQSTWRAVAMLLAAGSIIVTAAGLALLARVAISDPTRQR